MDAHRAENRLQAERAAEWLCRLETADLNEKQQFVQWLKQSPDHVREMLLAMAWNELLRDIDPHCKHNIDALTTPRSTVVRFSE